MGPRSAPGWDFVAVSFVLLLGYSTNSVHWFKSVIVYLFTRGPCAPGGPLIPSTPTGPWRKQLNIKAKHSTNWFRIIRLLDCRNAPQAPFDLPDQLGRRHPVRKNRYINVTSHVVNPSILCSSFWYVLLTWDPLTPCAPTIPVAPWAPCKHTQTQTQWIVMLQPW